jgi:hypothetical protein
VPSTPTACLQSPWSRECNNQGGAPQPGKDSWRLPLISCSYPLQMPLRVHRV